MSGPTLTCRGVGAYVGCLRVSGLVMLAARYSESDPFCDIRSSMELGSIALFNPLLNGLLEA
jgi:hypothetical protein